MHNIKEYSEKMLIETKEGKNYISYVIRPLFKKTAQYFSQAAESPTRELLLQIQKYLKNTCLYDKVDLENEAIFKVQESFYKYKGCNGDTYTITFKNIKTKKMNVNKGSTLYHLAKYEDIQSILENGLKPSDFTGDKVFLGKPKVFLSTQPILSEKFTLVDSHLKGRVQLEFDYDGEMPVYVDEEYHESLDSPFNYMGYIITEESIKGVRISQIQPK